MDFSQLQCYVKAYETGSFSKAAEALYLAQPTLTYKVRALERELGCQLFARTRRGVVPVEGTEAVYEQARELLAGQGRLQAAADALAVLDRPVVRVGFNRYPNVPAFLEAVEAFRRSRPDVEVRLDLGYTADPERQLANGSLDVVYYFDYADSDLSSLRFIELGRTPYCVLMTASDPLAARDALTLGDLAGRTLVTLKQFAHTAFQVPSLEQARLAGMLVDDAPTDNETLLLTIRLGGSVGVYPVSARLDSAGLTHRPLTDIPPLRHGLLLPSHGARSQTSEFADAVSAFIAERQAPAGNA